MTSKERFLKAINLEKPDRLPVTTHHVQKYFLDKYMNGMSNGEFFEHFGIDPITWVNGKKAIEGQIQIDNPASRLYGAVQTDEWRIEEEELPDPEYKSVRYTVHTPSGTLTNVIQSNDYTGWQSEYIIKEKKDIDIIIKHAPLYEADNGLVNRTAGEVGDSGLVRGHIPGFEIYGQPGCWQDMACLTGIEPLIMATFDDPEWIHTMLTFLRDRKLHYIKSMQGAAYDILELGGGDASTTVISPDIFQNFVAPYDSALIAEAKEAGQRIAYHTCGGMMPILEDIAAMKPAAMETFTPPGMGGDVDLAEAKKRIGDKVCFIGGFDQGTYFLRSTVEETRQFVREAFESAGEGGGFILAPSDHFFDARPELVRAFAEEARACTY